MSAVTAIDGIFVGHGVGSDRIAAVNICIPLLMIFTGIGLMAGVGSSVVASTHLARGKVKAARLNVTQSLLFVTVVTLVPSVFVMSFPRQTAYLLGASNIAADGWGLFGVVCSFADLSDVDSRFAVRDPVGWRPEVRDVVQYRIRTHQCRVGLAVHLSAGLGCDGLAFATSVSIVTGGVMALSYLLFFAAICDCTGETEQEEPEALAAQYRLPMPDRFFGSARRSDAGDVDVCR